MPEETIGGSSSEQDQEKPEVWTNSEIEEYLKKLKEVKLLRVKENEIAVLETSMGIIKFRFFPDVAPMHSASFKRLANFGFYDWTTFHRVVSGFIIQGGDILSKNDDPKDDGSGDPGFKLKAEFSDISHKRGIVSTARISNDLNGAGSQFFIMHANHPRLNGEYTVFGEVIEGMDVVDAIATTPVRLSRPVDPVYVKKARVIVLENEE